MPLVTVLMPVHNGEAFVAEAIESILGQTFGDFDFLILDDGSTDRSVEIVESYADGRIRLVRNEQQLGLIRTLNRGLDLASGKYVARMDADDISLPERLERQVDFMEANPDVGICGTWLVTMGDRDGVVWRHPESAEEIRCHLLFHAPIGHPTVCMRREMLIRHGLRFDEDYPHAEDYEFWSRASDVLPLVNLDSVLLRHRIHAGSVSQKYRGAQEAAVKRIHRERLGRLGLEPTDEELLIHRQLSPNPPDGEEPLLSNAQNWLAKLLRANEERRVFSRSAFERLLGQLWLAATYRNLAAGRPALSEFFRSPLARHVALKDRVHLVGHAGKRAVRSRSRQTGPRA